MKFALSREHRYFFQDKGYIQFNAFLNPAQIASLAAAIDSVVGDSEKSDLSSQQLFLRGHDMWRQEPLLQKWVVHNRFAEVIAELTYKTPIRLGYDQLLPGFCGSFFEGLYYDYLQKNATLENISSIRGVLAGVLVALNSSELPTNPDKSKIDLFPHSAGSVTFLSATTPLNLKTLLERPKQKFYLIVYAENTAWYVPQPEDPHTHQWKQIGYSFNNKLIDSLNPLIY